MIRPFSRMIWRTRAILLPVPLTLLRTATPSLSSSPRQRRRLRQPALSTFKMKMATTFSLAEREKSNAAKTSLSRRPARYRALVS